MRRSLFVFVAIVILLFVFICVQGEQTVWDCPGCGRTGNIKNYCRTCGHSAPWIEPSKSQNGTADNASSTSISTSEEKATNNSAAGFTNNIEDFKTVGNIVTFGHYEQDGNNENGSEEIEWTVLEVQHDKALLISNYALDVLPYHNENGIVKWEDCYLRKWLNNSFFKSAFSKDEQTAILMTDVNNNEQGYLDWNIDGGNNTQDKIFLLSYAEANRYFGIQLQNYNVPESYNNMKARVKPTTYAIMQGASTSSSNKTADGMASGWWWLRSPGIFLNSAAIVHYDGSLSSNGVSYHHGCVRPALWINLESDIF